MNENCAGCNKLVLDRDAVSKIARDRKQREIARRLKTINETSPVAITDLGYSIVYGVTYLWRPYNEELGHVIHEAGANERGAYTLFRDGIAIVDSTKVTAKVTAGKPKLAFTFRSTMEAIAAVREYATNGPYKDPNNWKGVADSDWDESLLRHIMSYF